MVLLVKIKWEVMSTFKSIVKDILSGRSIHFRVWKIRTTSNTTG